MLRPAKLSKITITASKRELRPIVEKLYQLQSVHLVEFSEGRDPAMHGFRVGRPLAEGQAASERLVRLRGLSRHLDLADHEPATRFSARDLERRLDDQIQQLELNITSAAESRARIAASVDGLEKERTQLEALKELPLRLEDFGGYQSLAVMVGRAEAAPAVEAAVRQAAPEAEVFVAPGTNHFAAFAPKAQAGKAAEAVARAGGQLLEAPKGQGSIPDRVDAIARELQQLQARLEAASQELSKYRQQHADFLVAAEEHLSIQSEKAEAPLNFATTDHAVVIECWAPEEEVQAVYSTLRSVVGEKFHFEVAKPGAHGHHAHAAPAQGQEAAQSHEGAEAETEAEVPPTKFRLARPFRPFQMFTEMVSVPRHDEIDPTPILALVLPMFLGFMIGDAGYGFLMLALGVWLVAKFGRKLPEARDIGLALAVSGVIALFFGAFIFADAFGIPLGLHEAGVTCQQFMAEHGETSWGCIFGQASVVHPVISKLEDISDLLMISVLAAFAH
ncbi:MAG TPA: V-type ATPase 116kDa subunit family protein, partial [Candidatus Thermoplasmatota archaeon]|nr:V-type ATPase 116kDa subunit family protein [Candidatus Thermoplasmatota archaeon]